MGLRVSVSLREESSHVSQVAGLDSTRRPASKAPRPERREAKACRAVPL